MLNESQLTQIYLDQQVKVNGRIVDLPRTKSELSTKITSQPVQQYQTTRGFSKFDQIWDNRDEASIAYGLAEQGSVLFIKDLEYADLLKNEIYRDQPIMTQTFLWPALQRNMNHDLIHTHVFLNFDSELLPPRPVDVLVIYPDLYKASDNKTDIINAVLNRAANYDFVFIPDSNGMGRDLFSTINDNKGIIRCLIYY